MHCRDRTRNYPMRLFVLDNYDSFTYNLVQYFGELNAETKVLRNDEVTLKELDLEAYDALVISPGPCNPSKAGISLDVISKWQGILPILGVCLGHQCIGQAFGGKIIRADRLMHGKTSPIHHHGQDLFAGLPDPFSATRYHSLLIEPSSFPQCLEITARAEDHEIMALRHREYPIWGVQFHPESMATENGIMILKNFLDLC